MNLEYILEKAKVNHGAFREVYDLTINRLFPFVLLRIKDRSESLDVCQEIYLSFWKSLPKFKYMGDAHFYSFLFTVARRQIIKSRIKKHSSISIEDVLDMPSDEVEREDYRFLLKQMAKLSDKERICVELRYFEDLGFADIALRLDIKEANAKMLNHRAIRKLRELMPNYE